MRKINEVEVITLLYSLYFASTLFLAPKLFSKESSDLYKALTRIVEDQQTWVYIALTVCFMYIVSFFFKHYLLTVLSNALGGLFLASIGVTYLFTYPNIGSGVFLLIALASFFRVYKVSNTHEDNKFQKLKNKVK